MKYESGDVHYQDEFGRTEKPREFLIKKAPDKPMRPGDLCGCGRGRKFKDCCQSKPEALRPAWNEKSIRERNLMLQNGIANVLELESGKDWVQVRRELTDDKISKIYNPAQRQRSERREPPPAAAADRVRSPDRWDPDPLVATALLVFAGRRVDKGELVCA